MSPKRKKKKSKRRDLCIAGRLGWLFAGLVFAFLVLEAFFRAAGFVIARFQRSSAPDGAEYTVLAEGDSFTYGIGGQDFPFQMEGILNERAGRRLFRVVNKGVPGLSTALLVDKLEEHIEEYDPDVLIVVAGENNSWNSIRLGDAGDLPLTMRLDRFFMHSRVYKFFRVMLIGLRHRTFHQYRAEEFGDVQEAANWITETGSGTQGGDFPEKGMDLYERAQKHEHRGEYEEARKLYARFAALNPDHPSGYSGMANCYLRSNRFKEAIATLEKAARLKPSPELEMIYYELGWANRRKGDTKAAVRWWQEGLDRYPESRNIYQAMVRVLYERGRIWEALDYAKRNPRVRRNPLHRFLERLHERHGRADVAALVSESFRGDLVRIAETARRHGVRVIFSSYPDMVHPEVPEVAHKTGAVFVDFRRIFRERFKSRREYISPDNCHCNTLGYRVMAEKFADEVEKLLGIERKG